MKALRETKFSYSVNSPLISSLNFLPALAGYTAILGGCLVLAGWLFRFPGLHRIYPALGTMSSHSAFYFILAGTALALLRREDADVWRLRLAQGCAGAVILGSLLTLGSLFGWNVNMDQMLFNGVIGNTFPGRMPTATALAFLFLGLSMLLLDVEIGRCRPAEIFTFAAVLIVLLALIGYAYGFVSLFLLPIRRPLAFHTLLMFLALSIGILIARPQRGLTALALGNSVGGVMVRRLLPAAVGIPILVGWLTMEGERAGFYPPVLNLAYYTLSIIVIFGALIWVIAGSLHAVDVRRQQAEEQIHKLNAELEQRVVERTAQLETANGELEAFSYSVSHDLRAPLRHIAGFIELLKSTAREDLDDQSKRYISIIASSSREMGCLIDDLLAFSRMGRTEMMTSSVHLRSVVEQVIRELDQRVANGRTKWIIGQLQQVEGDPAMLRVALTNLISNALKFATPGSERQIQIDCAEGPEDEIVFYVRDNGVGFDMRYVHKLFGVFQRLHSAKEFEGTGIGLATVRRIIHRHGGRTWAEGAVGEGATFYFSLPRNAHNGTEVHSKVLNVTK